LDNRNTLSISYYEFGYWFNIASSEVCVGESKDVLSICDFDFVANWGQGNEML